MAHKIDPTTSSLIKGGQHFVEITSRVAIVTVAVVGLFGGAGYLLDHQFGSWPVLFVISLLISMPVSLYMVYRVIKDLMSRKTQD